MKKVVLVSFNGDAMCFIHVLLNAIDMSERSWDARIILEGASTKLIPDLESKTSFLNPLWEKAREKKLVEGICKACSNKMGSLKAAEEAGLKPLSDMSGHPSLAAYLEKGFEVITF